ncbi:hypothetical protein GQ44DRAFT_730130 [Phaeosphaeriaceae sp. PMI808]|nr:hypothetical protein GQ44DRAFT_730130 [Phaeosphaeriaceae sp. PMI808]
MVQLDTPMSNAPLTPIESASPSSIPQSQPTVDFSPATVPYNEDFENALMDLILHPPSPLPNPPPAQDTTPMIPASQLPIPVSSPLRTHTSPIPGLHLTHANGYHTGGPGPAPETIRAFADKFISEHGIRDVDELRRVIGEEMSARKAQAKSRMLERERALTRNKEVEDELSKLRLQREDEVRVLEKMKSGKR